MNLSWLQGKSLITNELDWLRVQMWIKNLLDELRVYVSVQMCAFACMWELDECIYN